MSAVPDRARTLAFLEELWPHGLPDGAGVVPTSRDLTRGEWNPSLERAAEILADPTNDYEYLACAALRCFKRGRGKAVDAVAIPGFWFDLDTRGGDHKISPELLPTRPEALEFLDALPLAPTLVLDSGGGLYPWWLFREPWVFDDEEDRAQALGLLRGWQGFIQQQAKARGWELDGTADLSRVLRPEGALSHKYDPARLVRRVR